MFEACYTALDVPAWRAEIPFSGGLQYRVVLGGIVASSARAVIETPLEYAKVAISCASIEYAKVAVCYYRVCQGGSVLL